MFFLAGLLVAGLAGLIILPAFARRALRLSAARARMLAPLSMKEVVAERDLLRAEHALEQHRLERRVATLQDAGARQRADLGRQAGNIVALESEAARLTSEIGDWRDELAARKRDILGLEGDLSASRIVLNDFAHRLDRAASEISSLEEKLLALETVTDDQRTMIAGLATRASGLEMKLGDAAQTAKSKAIATEAEMARLSSEMAWRASEIAKLNAELGEALSKRSALVAELEKKNNELEQANQRLSAEASQAPAIDGGRRHANGAQPGEFSPPGDVALREAIARLAADVVRLGGAPAEAPLVRPNSSLVNLRESRAPSSQGPDLAEDATPAKLRQFASD
jgi:predicted  nucleic acid-binding Zn-ribbon protein